MKLDETTAAFGMFHLAFANLTQQLASAVFLIRRIKEPNLKFQKVFRIEFSNLCKALMAELNQFDGRQAIDMDVKYVRHFCSKARDLSEWRNERVHARVQIDEGVITIYNSRTCKQLSLNCDECLAKIAEAIGFALALDQNVASLLRNLNSDQDLHEMLREIFRTVEDPACELE
jgi:hypothetical protein